MENKSYFRGIVKRVGNNPMLFRLWQNSYLKSPIHQHLPIIAECWCRFISTFNDIYRLYCFIYRWSG